MEHKWEVKYDPYNYNGGVPPEAGVVWQNGAWEWEDTMTVTAVPIPSLEDDIKECITSNICLICGKKNCPYIQNDKNYQALLDACRKGDSANARKIYLQRFAPFRSMFSGERNKGLKKERDIKNNIGKNHSKSAQGWAPPLTWGPWVDLASHQGQDVYTISFDSESQAPSSFDVQIEYAESSQMKSVNTMGPGSYQVTDNDGAGTDRIRFKSHSIGQNVRINY